jgi:hypothetical protein
MNRKLLLLALAASLTLGLVAGKAQAQMDNINFCADPTNEAYDIWYQFHPFGPPKTCRTLCKENLHLCQNLIRLDIRCEIEELNAFAAWYDLGCQSDCDGDKQCLKSCESNVKAEAKGERQYIKSMIPEAKHNCSDYWNNCRMYCDSPA